MIRPGLLAVLAITFTPLSCFAQFGGMGGGMGGMGGMGGGMGGIGGSQPIAEERSVKVEMAGGQSVSGTLRIGSIFVDGEMGRYEISPGKVKAIRLSRLLDASQDGDPALGYAHERMQGTVVTTADKEISGVVAVPYWKLEFDFGTLTLKPAKLKTLTFAAEPEKKTANAPDAGAPDINKGRGQATPGAAAGQPHYSRMDKSVVVTSPAGDTVTFVDLETKKATSVRLSESKETPVKVTPIWGSGVAALMLRGPKITRIAASNGLTGRWHTQDLREPVKGEATPIVGAGVVVYGLGRYIYAFSAEAERWDVIELPKGVRAWPIVGTNTVTAEIPGHIYTFGGKTGKWNDLDIRALLETATAGDPPRK
ncbi:MAG: hypothetical protein ACLQGP_22290 [Isosphaeraceae bacterium]